jgi:hypothetical protein
MLIKNDKYDTEQFTPYLFFVVLLSDIWRLKRNKLNYFRGF